MIQSGVDQLSGFSPVKAVIKSTWFTQITWKDNLVHFRKSIGTEDMLVFLLVPCTSPALCPAIIIYTHIIIPSFTRAKWTVYLLQVLTHLSATRLWFCPLSLDGLSTFGRKSTPGYPGEPPWCMKRNWYLFIYDCTQTGQDKCRWETHGWLQGVPIPAATNVIP